MANAITGQGPFRPVQDHELRPIWWLQPVTAYLFEVIPITAYPPPGVDAPEINPLLRKMLFLVKLKPAELRQLLFDIDVALNGHELTAINARLVSSIRQVYESPWARYEASTRTHCKMVLRVALSIALVSANLFACYLVWGSDERARAVAPIAGMIAIIVAAVTDRFVRAPDRFSLASAFTLSVAFDLTVLIAASQA